MRKAMVVAAMLMMAAAGEAQTPAPELKVGDPAPDFKLAGERRQDLQALGFQGQGGGGARLVPQGLHPGLHDRVQVARRARRHDQEVQRHSTSWPASIRSRARRATRRSPRRTTPTSRSSATRPRRPPKPTACSTNGGMANRWTFYIGKDGKILAIDKAVKPATSAEDMAAKLGELKVEPAKP